MDPFVIICKSNVKCFVLLNGLLVLFFLSWIMVKYLRMPLDNWQSASLAAGLLAKILYSPPPPARCEPPVFLVWVFNVKSSRRFKVILW